MKKLLLKLMYRLGLYEVTRNIHKYSPYYKELQEALKEEVKKGNAVTLNYLKEVK